MPKLPLEDNIFEGHVHLYNFKYSNRLCFLWSNFDTKINIFLYIFKHDEKS